MTLALHADWGVVVPVKRLAVAKSRLAAFGDEGRRRLALAFAQDVVRAALDCPAVGAVVVVTDDDDAARVLSRLGALVQADGPEPGLNPALEHGAALLRAGDRRLGVAALSSDLPALRPDDLAAVLAVTAARAYVTDADGAGTTLLAAVAGAELRPAFGVGSAALHDATGAVRLTGPPGLRRDVDTPADLDEAVLLRVGPSTAAVLDDLGLVGTRPPRQGTMRG